MKFCFSKYLRNLLCLIFPEKCLICGKLGPYVCRECMRSFPRHSSCEIKRPPYVDLAIVCGYYGGNLKKIIKILKFSGRRESAAYIADFMLEYLAGDKRLLNVDFIAPIPLFSARERERGFNQAELIASRIAVSLGIPFAADCLSRIKETGFMYKLTKKERFQNIKGAFTVNMSVEGKKILLIDDILTTGATVSKAAEILKRNGCSSVYIAAAAHSVL